MSRASSTCETVGLETVLSIPKLRERILAYGDAFASVPPEEWPPRTDQEVRFWTGMEKAMRRGELDFIAKRAERPMFQGFWEVLRPILASGQLDNSIATWVEQRNPTFLEQQTALGNVAGVDDEGWIIFRDELEVVS